MNFNVTCHATTTYEIDNFIPYSALSIQPCGRSLKTVISAFPLTCIEKDSEKDVRITFILTLCETPATKFSEPESKWTSKICHNI